jgi:hypothetical protein
VGVSVYTVGLPDDLNERLRDLAHAQRRRPRSQAEILLMEAIRRAGHDGDASFAALAAAFETEGQRWFAQADSTSAGLVRRLILQSRGEAWFLAAARLRAAIPDATPIEARTVLPADDRPTAA